MNISITRASNKHRTCSAGLASLILATLLVISSQQAMSIPFGLFKESADKQERAAIIDLAGRKNAEEFADINRMLNAGNYEAVIKKANSVLKKEADSGLANEILGTAYFLSGQQPDAVAALKKAIAQDPDQSGPYTKLGIIYMESNNLADAEKLLQQAIRVDPGNRFAHQRLGMLYEYQNKDRLAIEHFRLGLEGTSNDYLGVAVNLGRLLNKFGYYQTTISVLEPRLPLNERLAEAHLVLATAYLVTGKYTKARIRFQRAIQLDQVRPEYLLVLAKAQRGEGDLTAAQATINKLLELQPNSANAKQEEGEILMRRGREKEAYAAFDRAVSLGISRSYVNKRIAKYHLERKDFAQARDIYQKMVTDGTADAFVYTQLSELLMGQGDIEKGEAVLHTGVKKFPDNGYLRLRYGSYLASTGKYEESLPVLRKSTELEPDDAMIWKTYALALARADHRDDSVKAAARLFELQPDKLETAIFYATQLEANNQWDEAEAIYRKILRAEPKNALVLNNLANILMIKNEYNEAEQMARRAMNSVSDNGNIQDTLGWILYKQGRLQEALEVLGNANKLAPETAVIWYHKGVVLAASGRQADARAAFEKALSLNSTADWVADAKTRL
jgi:tetratricopeptide (TPR) repeat protein